MIPVLSNERGVTLLEVVVASVIAMIALTVGLTSFKANMHFTHTVDTKQAFGPVEDDIKVAGMKIAADFLRKINTDGLGNKLPPASYCQVNYANTPFLAPADPTYKLASGATLTLLDRAHMTEFSGRYIISNTQPGNEKFQVAKLRCEDAQTVYQTNFSELADLRNRKGIYWCMGVSSTTGLESQHAKSSIANMGAIIEFLFVPINVQTGQQMTCNEYATLRNFSSPQSDLIIGMLYYTVYWADINTAGQLVTAEYTGSFAASGG
jgi:hypothetical protein